MGASPEEELVISILLLDPYMGSVLSRASDFLVGSAEDEREKLTRGRQNGAVLLGHCFP